LSQGLKREPEDATPEKVAMARERLDMLQNKLNAARIAYLHRAPLGGKEITYDDLRQVAQEMIEANYALQRLKFGRIQVRLSVAKLLRRGR
jgi:hypothetical protein